MFYNAGLQRALTNNLTLAINYVGNQSHHLINSTNTGPDGTRLLVESAQPDLSRWTRRMQD